MEVFKFDGVDMSEVINRMPASVKDDLPFGLLKLDPVGNILEYNMAQEEITGIRANDVIGKNFFLDVAVCTQRPEFYGRFKEGLAKGVLNQIFDYVFDFRMVPTRVRVHMFTSRDQRGAKIIWLMVKKMNKVAQEAPQSQAPVVQYKTVPFNPNSQTRDVPVFQDRAPMESKTLTSNNETDSEFGDILINLEEA
jgi:photoactive yellow protein